MSEFTTITGEVENGRRGVAVFPPSFYSGPVGIRERDGGMEIAFFAPPMRYRLPVEGTVDGVKVRVVSVAARDLDPAMPVPARSTTPRAIVAAVVPTI